MAEDTPEIPETPEPEAVAAAEEPAAPAPTGDEATAEKPKRTRTRAKAAADADAPTAEAAEGEAPKPRRRRTPKPAAEEPETPKETAAAATAGEAEEAPAAPRRVRRTVGPPSLRGLGRGRRTPERVGEPPVVYATAKYVRSSARKARLVCDHIRGKSVPEARAILAFAPRGVAKDWAKLLESAVANAEHNHELIGDELKIKAITADVGPTLKRFRPRAQGRATPINKRTTHLSIALTPKE
jgi:ribosomal protein L22